MHRNGGTASSPVREYVVLRFVARDSSIRTGEDARASTILQL